MDANILKGKWKQLRGNAKMKWGDLTDDDLDKMDGARDKMIGVIQEKYGKARKVAEREVDEFLKEN